MSPGPMCRAEAWAGKEVGHQLDGGASEGAAIAAEGLEKWLQAEREAYRVGSHAPAPWLALSPPPDARRRRRRRNGWKEDQNQRAPLR